MRYVSRPQEVDAIRWTGDNFTDLCRWLVVDKIRLHATAEDEDAVLELLAGKDGVQEWVPVPIGHWLVHQPDDTSDVWPVDDDYFQAKYLRAPCPDDTNGDGDCGKRRCPYCGEDAL